MDKQDTNSDAKADRVSLFTPSGETCILCSRDKNLQKYDGDLFCPEHLNQKIAME